MRVCLKRNWKQKGSTGPTIANISPPKKAVVVPAARNKRESQQAHAEPSDANIEGSQYLLDPQISQHLQKLLNKYDSNNNGSFCRDEVINIVVDLEELR
jgi:hypothetical protein